MTGLTHAQDVDRVPRLEEGGLPPGLPGPLRDIHGLPRALGQPLGEELLDRGDVPIVLPREVAGDRGPGVAGDFVRKGGDTRPRRREVVVDLPGEGLARGIGGGLLRRRCCSDFHLHVPPIR